MRFLFTILFFLTLLNADSTPNYRINDTILDSFPDKYDDIVEEYKKGFKEDKEDKTHLAIFYFTSSSVPTSSFLHVVSSAVTLDNMNGITVTEIYQGFDKHFKKYSEEIVGSFEKKSEKRRDALLNQFKIRVDPIYFSEHNITKVPRITLASCADDSYPSDCEPLFYMTGDSSLAYFFEILSAKDEAYLDYYYKLKKIIPVDDGDVDISVKER